MVGDLKMKIIIIYYTDVIKDNCTEKVWYMRQTYKVEEAARRAYIFDYINGLLEKFDSLISEGGNNLSGGQR